MKILVTTDGSARSLEVLAHAGAFAKAALADLLLLRVLDPRVDCADQLALHLDQAVAKTSAAWTNDLAAVLDRAGVAGTPVVATTRHGEDTWDAILRVAAEQDAAMIAMTTRGAGRIHRLLLGSVAMGLVGHTTLPVMVTGPAIRPPAEQARYHILATTDGSDASLAVVRALRPTLNNPEMDITLLGLCWPGAGEQARAECHGNVARLKAELGTTATIAELVREVPLIEGVTDGVLEAALELGASAIAMATHGHGAAYHVLTGSVAMGVVSHSPLPVILARSAPPASNAQPGRGA